MAYATKYRFKFQSINGSIVQIDVQKNGYSGNVINRAIGRAPVLKRQMNGGICGTSLEFYAECSVDGEFAEFYTSNPKEYKVILRRNNTITWTGFITPELYSEPDIAPPYDVSIVATDGLGELKQYDFTNQALSGAYGLLSLQQHLTYLLGHTGLSLDMFAASELRGASYSSASNFFTRTYINLCHKVGENCYDVLQYLLDSLGCLLMQWHNWWIIARKVDIESCIDSMYEELTGYKTTDGHPTTLPAIFSMGKMGVSAQWPVGQMSTKIEPAKKRVVVQSPWKTFNPVVSPDMESDTWGSYNQAPTYDSAGQKYVCYYAPLLPPGVSQYIYDIKLGFSVVVNWRLSADDTGYKYRRRYAFTTYGNNPNTYVLYKNSDGELVWTLNGSISNDAARIDSDSSAVGTDRSNAESVSDILPVLLENGVPPEGSLRIVCQGVSKASGKNVYIYHCDVAISVGVGYRNIININNGARGEDSEQEVAGGMLTTEYANLALFLTGVFWDSNTNPYTPIQYFVDSHQFGSTQTFLELAAYSRALEVALPRLMMEGILNTPSSFDIPLLLKKSSVYYWVNTFEWDLRNDEIKVEAISLPAASFTTTSEYIEPAMIPPSEGSGSSSSGGASSGTSLEEVQAWVNSQGFLTGITSQQVINALGYTPVSVFDARLLSLVGAPTIVRRKGWRNATAGNETFFDVMEVSHPLLGVSGFEMVLMAYRKRNSRKVTSGYQGAWKNKKGWAVAAGNYDVCGFVPFTSVSGKFNVQDLRTYILKRFVRIDGQTAVDIFTNMTASALDNTYGSTPKAFYGYSGHMRLGFAIRRVNPAFEAATYGQTNLKDTFQCVYSSITGKYEPRYLYSAIAPMTAFLRTYGDGKVRNILDFSLIPQG